MKPLTFLILLLSLSLPVSTFSQVSNDDCSTAINLDSVWNYINGNNCWNGLPSDTTIIDSTTNALVNFPYPLYPLPCLGYTNAIGSPSNDVWFKVPFVYGCDLIIGTSISDTMHMVVWFGDSCNYLAHAACFTLVPGDTFVTVPGNDNSSTYFQLSGNGPNNFTNFNICLQTNAFCMHFPYIGLPTPFVCLDYNTTVTPATSGTSGDGSIGITIVGGNPPYSIQWNDGGSGFIRNNLMPGNYVFTILDSVGCITTDTISVGVLSSIDEQTSQGILIAPNPVSIGSNIELTSISEPGQITITETSGKAVYTGKFIPKTQTNISMLKSGIYFLYFTNSVQSFYSKLVVTE